MRRVLSFCCVLALLGGLLLLVGCGGDAAGLSPSGSTTTTATGQVKVNIAWPPYQATSRYIPAFTQSVLVMVEGAGITTEISGTITRPASTISLTVPAGTERTITVIGKDGDGIFTASLGRKTMPILANTVNTANITLLGAEDLTNDPIILDPSNGMDAAEAVITTPRDSTDAFVFDAVAGEQYTITVETLAQNLPMTGYTYGLTVSVDGQDVSFGTFNFNAGSVQYDEATKSLAIAPTISGPITIAVTSFDTGILNTPAQQDVYYVVTVTKGGDGTLDVNIN